jgi:hypothetical protein
MSSITLLEEGKYEEYFENRYAKLPMPMERSFATLDNESDNEEDEEREYYEKVQSLVGNSYSSFSKPAELSRTNSSHSSTEYEYLEMPVIHMLQLGDTLKTLSKQYEVSVGLINSGQSDRLLQWLYTYHLTNSASITPKVMQKRKFIVIPSPSTFCAYDSDHDYPFGEVGPHGDSWLTTEQHDLCQNFCLLFSLTSMDLAEYYLRLENFNLAAAVETYQFDIC